MFQHIVPANDDIRIAGSVGWRGDALRRPTGYNLPARRGQEAVTTAMHRFDIARRFGIVAQSPAQFLDRVFEHALADVAPVPDGIQQHFFAEQAARMLAKKGQDIKGLGGQRQKLVITE
ncbi:MAG: hypothetical protein WAW36_14575 [Methylovulum miyakonense]